MKARVNELIEKLKLHPHPEGGFYSETYRSNMVITSLNRQLMTSIYFLLTSENVSKFHRIKSDEIWFFHEGSSLIVHTLSEEGHKENRVGLNLLQGETPQFLVEKETIFGSTVAEEDSYSLVSCIVAPGFDFEDFELFSREQLEVLYPDNNEIISRLTNI
jgi:predicted cupin superfamily sugar epimerase